MATPFSFSIGDRYRVFPRPRWGHGQPPHPVITRVFERARGRINAALDEISAHRDALHAIAHERDGGNPVAPFWNNPWFSTLDAASLVGFILSRRPKRYLEIGSGHSTMFAAYAIKSAGMSTHIRSIDPNPRTEIDALCNDVIRRPMEFCAPELFDELEAGDILFFDGSHRTFQNSDVTVFFLDMLPRLQPGVIVHVHDIFLPFDYPPAWEQALYSEQYLLAGMLMCGSPLFDVLLPNYFAQSDDALGARVRTLFAAPGGGIPFHYPNKGETLGCSFWMEMKGG